jgi:hypothetical protein
MGDSGVMRSLLRPGAGLSLTAASFWGAGQLLVINVTLISRSEFFMHSKLIYWIPIVVVFVTLAHYDKDNGMGTFWSVYQTAMILIIIWTVAFFST